MYINVKTVVFVLAELIKPVHDRGFCLINRIFRHRFLHFFQLFNFQQQFVLLNFDTALKSNHIIYSVGDLQKHRLNRIVPLQEVHQ